MYTSDLYYNLSHVYQTVNLLTCTTDASLFENLNSYYYWLLSNYINSVTFSENVKYSLCNGAYYNVCLLSFYIEYYQCFLYGQVFRNGVYFSNQNRNTAPLYNLCYGSYDDLYLLNLLNLYRYYYQWLIWQYFYWSNVFWAIFCALFINDINSPQEGTYTVYTMNGSSDSHCWPLYLQGDINHETYTVPFMPKVQGGSNDKKTTLGKGDNSKFCILTLRITRT